MQRISWYLTLFVVSVFPSTLYAQFGAEVAVNEGAIAVMKPGGAFDGLGYVNIYSEKAGEWKQQYQILTEAAIQTGQPFSAAMWMNGGQVFLGGGDHSAKLGAFAYVNEVDAWVPGGKLWLDNSPDAGPAENMQVADFMRYIQPAHRTVAGFGETVAIGVIRVGPEKAGIYLFQKEGENWRQMQHLQVPGHLRESEFGASVALDAQKLVVGAPGAGQVYIYKAGEDGAYVLQDSLGVKNLAKDAGFGQSVLLFEDPEGENYKHFIIAGAPRAAGKGAAYVYTELQDNTWGLLTELEPEILDAENAMFGAEMAVVDNEFWIGAPNARNGKGIVQHHAPTVMNAPIEVVGMIEGTEEGSRFGASIAAYDGVAVIGSPGGNGGRGKVDIWRKNKVLMWEHEAEVLPGESLAAINGEPVRCEEGMAAGFACEGVDLLAYIPFEDFGADHNERVSDVWGWTDPLTDREYALLGRTGGAAIIEVTNPVMPHYLGLVPANRTSTRDLKVYKDHLFFTGDGAGHHGLVIFDLTRLRNVQQAPAEFAPDTVYTGIASAHNLILNEESGFAYPVGASRGGETCGGGLHMIDIREPLKPTFAGCYTDTIGLFSDGRTHDGQCVIYAGPDDRYAGQEICFVSNETALRIVDVSDKSNPEPLAAARYPRVAYVHQGWLTEDHRYFYLDDELDELVGMTDKTRTLIWDIAELDDPVLVGTFEGATPATDHNLYVKGDRMYQANYQAGFSLWDISNPETPRQIGHFDTTPGPANPPGFVGAWTAYPYFKSGTVVVSSMNEGLFLLKPSDSEMP